MLKKSLIIEIVIAGCSLAFAFFSFLVFITRGKSAGILKYKLLLGVILIALSGSFSGCQPDISAIANIISARPTTTIPPTCYIAPPPSILPTAKRTATITPICYIAPPPTILPTSVRTAVNTPMCYMPPIPTIIATIRPTPESTPMCYMPPLPTGTAEELDDKSN